jgi:hypothetical protein
MTLPHVASALERCSEINNNPRRWAKMEVIPTPVEQIVRVIWGHVRFDGVREKEIQTLSFQLSKDGKVVHIVEHTHS